MTIAAISPDARLGPLSFERILAAAVVVSAELAPSPEVVHPLLDLAVGTSVVVKHENALPTGSFKVRGGVHLASRLTAADRLAGLVTTSTGNHAQSVAYAARLAGTRATVVMPTTAPRVKQDAVLALGGTVVLHGPTLAESRLHAQELAARTGARYVDPAEADIVLGHATAYLELFGAHPDLEAVYVPIGSGTGAAGACLVRDVLAPRCRVIGVQSEAAPAAYFSWSGGELVSAPCTTRVSGLATASGYPLPQSVLRGGLSRFLLVGDEDIDAAARLLATHAHTLAEGAGAASLAGLLADPDRPARCGVVCTGGNASIEEIARLSARPAAV